MKTWDVIIIGAGVIGLSLAISLRKQGLRVLVIERGEPGREASYAAAGMLAPNGNEIPQALMEFAQISAGLYPAFVHELEDESGLKIDFSHRGTLLLSANARFPREAKELSDEEVSRIEPALDVNHLATANIAAAFIAERTVDPRSLLAALIKTTQHREVDISSGTEVKSVLISGEHVAGVQTERTSYAAPLVVNCAGAWSGTIGPHRFPVNPVKGHMLAVVHGPELKHVVRGDDVYLVPRADGRLVIGSTLENAGYDRRVDINTIKRVLDSASALVPALAEARQHDAWAGLRPGTPDCLPILGPTATPGYFVATGHYRDGILLAPVTAQVVTAVILGKTPPCDVANFAPSRFVYKAA